MTSITLPARGFGQHGIGVFETNQNSGDLKTHIEGVHEKIKKFKLEDSACYFNCSKIQLYNLWMELMYILWNYILSKNRSMKAPGYKRVTKEVSNLRVAAPVRPCNLPSIQGRY
ncbi:unnamed protein product [Lepeophtheirus salmonis]|uniref:(salmon louse) hypothetical protein n=1 Tax=Lepeophtheirus salmonis TaxID=72036 RepID=A0A7R8CEV9_LEPSM|nr:unnamed protein product [Lepeophtheirus salmonis]CAF2799545.1 unnamed protein product [Lepeophtheirus salmonis]